MSKSRGITLSSHEAVSEIIGTVLDLRPTYTGALTDAYQINPVKAAELIIQQPNHTFLVSPNDSRKIAERARVRGHSLWSVSIDGKTAALKYRGPLSQRANMADSPFLGILHMTAKRRALSQNSPEKRTLNASDVDRVQSASLPLQSTFVSLVTKGYADITDLGVSPISHRRALYRYPALANSSIKIVTERDRLIFRLAESVHMSEDEALRQRPAKGEIRVMKPRRTPQDVDEIVRPYYESLVRTGECDITNASEVITRLRRYLSQYPCIRQAKLVLSEPKPDVRMLRLKTPLTISVEEALAQSRAISQRKPKGTKTQSRYTK